MKPGLRLKPISTTTRPAQAKRKRPARLQVTATPVAPPAPVLERSGDVGIVRRDQSAEIVLSAADDTG